MQWRCTPLVTMIMRRGTKRNPLFSTGLARLHQHLTMRSLLYAVAHTNRASHTLWTGPQPQIAPTITTSSMSHIQNPAFIGAPGLPLSLSEHRKEVRLCHALSLRGRALVRAHSNARSGTLELGLHVLVLVR